MSRLKALDGLRAVAVIAVLASHTLPKARGGFLGVDVFFVLSGYLITSLLIKEYRATGRIDFAEFYRRRAARLFPAYVLMVVLTVPLMIGPLSDVGDWPWQLVVATSVVYGSNWAQAFSPDHMGALLHTWSLSVEEQFYLIWPVSFVALVRSRRSMAGWLAGAAALTVLLRAAGWTAHHSLWPYFASITHGDGLLLGALIGVLLAGRSGTVARPATGTGKPPGSRRELRQSRRQAPTGVRALLCDRFGEQHAWLAAAVLGIEMLTLDLPAAGTYYYGLTASALATGVIVRRLVLDDSGPMSRLLSLPPLVAVGRVSYGLYLYHMPIFLLVQHTRLGFGTVLAVESVGTALVTTLSWYLVERPAQRWVARRWPRGLVPPPPGPKPGTGPIPLRVPAPVAGLAGTAGTAGLALLPRSASVAPVPAEPARRAATANPVVPGLEDTIETGLGAVRHQAAHPTPPAGWPVPLAQPLPGLRPDVVPAGPAWEFVAVHPVQVARGPAPVFAVPAWDLTYAAPPHPRPAP